MMKKLAMLLILANLANFAIAGETKKVCNEQKDRKGKPVQVCKEIKVHKKLDATRIPGK